MTTKENKILGFASDLGGRFTRGWLGLLRLCVLLALFPAFDAAAERGLPAQHGIKNFGQVSATLYRGAQPDTNGIKQLKELGVKTIINLRMAGDVWKPEATLAQAHGIVYTNIALHGMGRPSDEQVSTLLSLITNSPGPVFIHCEHGCDRTGTIVACYRMQQEKWSSEDALREADRYGLSHFERAMRRFIREFGKSQ